MDGDVYLVVFRDLFEALVKVLHVLDKKGTAKLEVPLLVLVVIDHMYHDLVLQVSGVIKPSED